MNRSNRIEKRNKLYCTDL